MAIASTREMSAAFFARVSFFVTLDAYITLTPNKLKDKPRASKGSNICCNNGSNVHGLSKAVTKLSAPVQVTNFL